MAKETGTILLIGGAAALGYYGYTQGWFANLFPAAASAVPKQPTTTPGPTPVPPLGTKVTNVSDALAQ